MSRSTTTDPYHLYRTITHGYNTPMAALAVKAPPKPPRESTREVSPRPEAKSIDDFSEQQRLVDPTSAEGKLVTELLSSVGDRLIKAGKVSLTHKVTYHLSDEATPNAFVAIDGSHARIVVSKGLMDFVRSEDQLAAVIGHELMHVHFRERVGHENLKITKVEEYIADVASTAVWLIRAGYAPKEAVALFDQFQSAENPNHNGIQKLFRPWDALHDVHGLNENRSEAINAVIAREIQAAGSVPTQATPLAAKVIAAAKASTHETFIERLRSERGYQRASPEARFERVITELEALHEGRYHRLPALSLEFSALLKEIPLNQPLVERVYAMMSKNKVLSTPTQRTAKSKRRESLLDRVMRAAEERTIKLSPPERNQKIAATIRRFVAAKDDRTIIQLGSEIAAFSREWRNGEPGLHHSLKGSFSGRQGPEALTESWSSHVKVATRLAMQGKSDVLESLWALSAYDHRLITAASDDLLRTAQEIRPLVPLAAADELMLSGDGTWQSGGFRSDPDKDRANYAAQAGAELAERSRKQEISQGGAIETIQLPYKTLAAVPIDVMRIEYDAVLAHFTDELTHPSRLLGGGNLAAYQFPTSDSAVLAKQLLIPETQEMDVSPQLEAHYRASAALAKHFTEMLKSTEPAVAQLATERIRAFFLATNGPCFASFVGPDPLDDISGSDRCRHPLVIFAASSPALQPEERIHFLHGLEDRLPLETWEKVYFTGAELPTNEAKLEYLQNLAPYHEPSRRIAARLLTEEFEGNAVGEMDVGVFISRYSRLMPAARLIADGTRQIISDHIVAQRSWSTDLASRIDLFRGLEQGRLFPPPETGIRESLRAGIITDLNALTDPAQRLALTERLLLAPDANPLRVSEVLKGGETLASSTARQELINRSVGLNSLKDPPLREVATEIWASTIRQQIALQHPQHTNGLDDGSTAYIESVKPRLTEILGELQARLPVQERREMLNALAVELELQEALSFYLRDSVSSSSRVDIADAHEYFRSAEAGFEFLNQDPQRREAALRFLAHPLSLESIATFATEADLYRNREVRAVEETLQQLRAEAEREKQQNDRLLDYTDKLGKRTSLSSVFYDAYVTLVDLDGEITDGLDPMVLGKEITDILPTFLTEEEGETVLPAETRNSISLSDAHDYITASQNHAVTVIKAALQREKETFRSVYTTAEKLLAEGKHPFEKVKRALEVELARLPAHPFVDTLEIGIAASTTTKALQRLILRADKNLDQEFASIAHVEEQSFKTKIDNLLEETKGKVERSSLQRSEFNHWKADFQEEISQLVAELKEYTPTLRFSLNDQRSKSGFKIVDISFIEELTTVPTDKLPIEAFKLSESQSAALDSVFLQLLADRDNLLTREGEIKARNARLDNLIANVTLQRERLKSLPVPINSIITSLGDEFEQLALEDMPAARNHLQTAWEFQGAAARIYPEVRGAVSPSATPLEEQQARQLYELFWSQSAEVRAIALKLLLLPPQSEYEDRTGGTENHYKNAFDFVADQIFPAGMKYGSEARDILRIFLEETDPSLRGFMLGALMSASEKIAGAPEEYTAGKRLAMILSMLGPAEKKLGQAINSHPLTPEDLRSDTKSIKSHSDPLNRWDLLDRIQEALPPAYKDTFPRFGRAFGAASYYLAVECDDSVLSILRPNARTLADTGLARMERVAARLKEIPSLAKVAGPFEESISHARRMIEDETDHAIGVLQQRNAWRRYSGVSVTIEGETFEFRTAGWKACGPEFRHQEKIEGEHFLDIIEKEGRSDPFVRKAALAHLTVEFLNLLSGDPFDHDRHGAQSKIERGTDTHKIGLFDHGCMAKTPPSDEEKRECAEIMCDLVDGYLQGSGGILERAHEIIREKREARNGESPSYLISFERGLLALNDFMRFDANGQSSLLQPNDIGMVLASVIKTAGIDPIFAETVATRFGGSGTAFMLALLPHSQVCELIAQKIEEKLGKNSEISMTFKPQEVMPEPIVFDAPRMGSVQSVK